ncbi:MAG: tRNA modification GTPase [Planctomycetes bacterium]|nr:tRNA modification GTPase [Planctomycetota bacterium]
MSDVDTIVAIATPPGAAARGIVRISGPRAIDLLQSVFTPHVDDRQATECPAMGGVSAISDGGRLRTGGSPRVVSGVLRLADPFHLVECRLYLWPGRRGYTREPSGELHLPGSSPVLAAAVAALCRAGARIAEPGEFTLRAFLAGRIDLTQAEAVVGVIDARSRRELRTALRQLAGGLAAPLNELRDSLLDLLAGLEAELDFADEEIDRMSSAERRERIGAVANALERLSKRIGRRLARNEHPRVALTGAPNAGKSSLFNALAGDDAAIVADRSGTTRDYLSRTIDLDGLVVELIDTAGIDAHRVEDVESADAREAAREQVESADVQVHCVDGAAILGSCGVARLRERVEGRLIVRTKADLAQAWSDQELGQPTIAVSVVTGTGLDRLRAAARALTCAEADSEDVVMSTSHRCVESIDEALDALRAAVSAGDAAEWVAAELRGAADAIGRVAGSVHTDDILDRIFSRFCIGK